MSCQKPISADPTQLRPLKRPLKAFTWHVPLITKIDNPEKIARYVAVTHFRRFVTLVASLEPMTRNPIPPPNDLPTDHPTLRV